MKEGHEPLKLQEVVELPLWHFGGGVTWKESCAVDDLIIISSDKQRDFG